MTEDRSELLRKTLNRTGFQFPQRGKIPRENSRTLPAKSCYDPAFYSSSSFYTMIVVLSSFFMIIIIIKLVLRSGEEDARCVFFCV
jgi:hypothetical protein